MKDIREFIVEKYEKKVVLPAFEYSVIKDALEAYKDNDDRKKNEGNGRPSMQQLEDVLVYLDDKKNFKYVGKKYEKEYKIPPFEMNVITQALEAYKDNDDRKKNEGNGRPSMQQLEEVIKFLKK